MKIKAGRPGFILILIFACVIHTGCGNNGAAQIPTTPGAAPAQWGVANLVETDPFEASAPQVAMNPDGNAIAVWVQRVESALRSIRANRFVPGRGWGSPESIIAADFAAFNASDPQVAVDPKGNAIAVWAQGDGVAVSIWSNRFVPGTGWGSAEVIETSDLNASEPQVAVDSNGNAVAIWVQPSDTSASIWANRFVPGAGWGAPVLIETGSLAASSPKVAMSPDGVATAVWVQSDGTSFSIWSNSAR